MRKGDCVHQKNAYLLHRYEPSDPERREVERVVVQAPAGRSVERGQDELASAKTPRFSAGPGLTQRLALRPKCLSAKSI